MSVDDGAPRQPVSVERLPDRLGEAASGVLGGREHDHLAVAIGEGGVRRHRLGEDGLARPPRCGDDGNEGVALRRLDLMGPQRPPQHPPGERAHVVTQVSRHSRLLPLRDTARAMSDENVEIVRGVLDAFHRGDAEAALAFFDPDVVVDFSPRPDSGIAHGHEGLSAIVTDWVTTFEDFREETDEIRDLGDRVLVAATQHGRGKGSGVEIEHQYAWIYEFQDGRISRLAAFQSLPAALEAAGLSE